MTMAAVTWTGMGLAFLAAFLLSLIHIVRRGDPPPGRQGDS